jgi:hypothetical protein
MSVVAQVHAAALSDNGTFSAIPYGASPILMEVGTSDRNTLDQELLPHMPSAFLVSFEPLVDKYARALARRTPSDKVKDSFEPLGMHHDRGLILPMAVGPVTSASGELQSFHVGANAGCSSLLKINHSPIRRPKFAATDKNLQVFGVLCRPSVEIRQVWVVPLSQALMWVGKEVDFLKVDAQGTDLRVALTGGPQLRTRVRRLLLEVIGDECAPLYKGQPRCSQVCSQVHLHPWATTSSLTSPGSRSLPGRTCCLYAPPLGHHLLTQHPWSQMTWQDVLFVRTNGGEVGAPARTPRRMSALVLLPVRQGGARSRGERREEVWW